MYLEIAVIVILTVVNGLLAMSELAVVSSRSARLRLLAEQGSTGAATALRLAEHPGRFLSTVQIGITLVGVLSGAFSGATLGARLSGWLAERGLSQGLAEAFGVGTVVVAITYLSLIIGELVPKQIALKNPERVAVTVAPAMVILSKLGAPLVWLLDKSGTLILALLGQKGGATDTLTEEEVKSIIADAETAGVIEQDERELISGVMRLADRSARALMTPRREVEVIDLADDPAAIREQVRLSRRSRLPVADGNADAIVGVVMAKDVMDGFAANPKFEVRGLVQQAPIVLDRTMALDVLRLMRASRVHMTLVFDEYGHFEGIITANDMLEAITGAFDDEDDEKAIVTRADGSLLISGWMPADEFAHALGLPNQRDAEYETAAGFALTAFQHLPEVGESFEQNGWRFEVVDLDGRRIDKILASRVVPA
ncbi:HlyC/CorC family transporter [Phreatobacter aquaticus]|uniref:HlyC/CorC family transporter n=1 Tax=Phreatobacter aquaticus TaxID=2570229 RepID=A0A4D7QTT1_9HYPH|nr:hemolysin family protein [Phreatobacter aquaticus]QCK88674.1 HlyC/CorC family transporter [Phreatobacter aquaticus]